MRRPPPTRRLPVHSAHQLASGPIAALWRKPSPAGRALRRRLRPGRRRRNQLQGKELSFNNLVDLEACWELTQEFDEPTVIIVKHTNPCGAATGATILEAYRKALACDPVSAFGGVIGINRPVNAEAAEEIAKLFVEAIAAPAFTPDARERFSTKKNLRLVEVHAAPPRPVIKHVSGGLLMQDADTGRVTEDELKVVTWRPPTAEELRSLHLCLARVQAR